MSSALHSKRSCPAPESKGSAKMQVNELGPSALKSVKLTDPEEHPGPQINQSVPRAGISNRETAQPLNLPNKTQSGQSAGMLSGTPAVHAPPKNNTAPQKISNPPSQGMATNCKTDKMGRKGGGISQLRTGIPGVTRDVSTVERGQQADPRKDLAELSTGDDSSLDSDHDSSLSSQDMSVQASQDWKPARSLLEHVFVTDVTANLITVTVKESPTSVGFFNMRPY